MALTFEKKPRRSKVKWTGQTFLFARRVALCEAVTMLHLKLVLELAPNAGSLRLMKPPVYGKDLEQSLQNSTSPLDESSARLPAGLRSHISKPIRHLWCHPSSQTLRQSTWSDRGTGCLNKKNKSLELAKHRNQVCKEARSSLKLQPRRLDFAPTKVFSRPTRLCGPIGTVVTSPKHLECPKGGSAIWGPFLLQATFASPTICNCLFHIFGLSMLSNVVKETAVTMALTFEKKPRRLTNWPNIATKFARRGTLWRLLLSNWSSWHPAGSATQWTEFESNYQNSTSPLDESSARLPAGLRPHRHLWCLRQSTWSDQKGALGAVPLASDFCKSDHLQLSISHFSGAAPPPPNRPSMLSNVVKETAVTMALTFEKKPRRLTNWPNIATKFARRGTLWRLLLSNWSSWHPAGSATQWTEFESNYQNSTSPLDESSARLPAGLRPHRHLWCLRQSTWSDQKGALGAVPLASDFCKSDHLQLSISHFWPFNVVKCCQRNSRDNGLNIRKKTKASNELAKHRNQVCKTRHFVKVASLKLVQLAPRRFCHAVDGIWEQLPKFCGPIGTFSTGREFRKASSRSAAPSIGTFGVLSNCQSTQWRNLRATFKIQLLHSTRVPQDFQQVCRPIGTWGKAPGVLGAVPLASDFCKSDHLQLSISHFWPFNVVKCCQRNSRDNGLNIRKKTKASNELAKHRNQVCKTRHFVKVASLKLVQLAPRRFCHAVDGTLQSMSFSKFFLSLVSMSIKASPRAATAALGTWHARSKSSC